MNLTVTLTVTPDQMTQILKVLKGEPTYEAINSNENKRTELEGQTSLYDPRPADPVGPAARDGDGADPARPDAETNPVTRADVFAKAASLAKMGKQKELAAAFTKFGAKKFSDFDAMPEKLADLMAELVKIDG